MSTKTGPNEGAEAALAHILSEGASLRCIKLDDRERTTSGFGTGSRLQTANGLRQFTVNTRRLSR